MRDRNVLIEVIKTSVYDRDFSKGGLCQRRILSGQQEIYVLLSQLDID